VALVSFLREGNISFAPRSFCQFNFETSTVNMTDTASPANSAPAKVASPKKAKSTGSKKPKAVPSHPPIASMVNSAIKNLKERGGSSTQAIKKYIAANNKCDVEKLAPFIRRYLKSAVTKGGLVQTKGKGASGSFKLKDKSEAKKPVAPKAKKAKKPSTTKPAGEKKKSAPKKKSAAAKKPKTPKKKAEKKPKAAKKSTKPKTPKKPKVVKKATTPKKAAAKKVAKK
jgi:histone H1/5